MEFSFEEKRLLFQLVRESIESKLYENRVTTQISIEEYPILATKCGVFVTLTIADQLRGCIGYITSEEPLYQTIKDAAIGAAFDDPRFHPLTPTEYEQVEIEISVLSEPFPMKDYNDIVLGKHGLILQEGNKRGLLLPQVPVEHGMTKEQYLDAICKKTGLRQSLWHEKLLTISLFTATVFSEKNLETENASS